MNYSSLILKSLSYLSSLTSLCNFFFELTTSVFFLLSFSSQRAPEAKRTLNYHRGGSCKKQLSNIFFIVWSGKQRERLLLLIFALLEEGIPVLKFSGGASVQLVLKRLWLKCLKCHWLPEPWSPVREQWGSASVGKPVFNYHDGEEPPLLSWPSQK